MLGVFLTLHLQGRGEGGNVWGGGGGLWGGREGEIGLNLDRKEQKNVTKGYRSSRIFGKIVIFGLCKLGCFGFFCVPEV